MVIMNPQTKFGRNRIKITTFIVYQPKKVTDRQTDRRTRGGWLQCIHLKYMKIKK